MPWWLLPYQFLFPLLGVGVAIKLLSAGRGRSLREGKDPIRQRLGLLNKDELARLSGKVVWIHAASVGEVQAATPLVARISALPDAPKILLTSSTYAGRERAAQLKGVALASLAPIDFYPAVQAFLSRVRPSVLVLVETELWPLTIYLSLRRGVRLAIVNGRVSDRSFPRYRFLRPFLAPLLRHVSRAAVQTETDRERFLALGIEPEAVRATGNLKLDVPPLGKAERNDGLKTLSTLGWDAGPIWIAASTRPGEEEGVLEALAALRHDHPSLKLILAPRHVERASEVAYLLERAGVPYARFSTLAGAASGTDCLLIDELGRLNSLFAVSTVAFVGGTLVPVGGHNLLEPALAGVPVLYGPHHETQAMSAEALQNTGGGIEVADARGLAREIYKLLKHADRRAAAGKAASEAAKSLSGAAARTLAFLSPLL
ncbi:MAG: 3-deoxy-D-manno-octulosonic acid transferase [Elusimicrobia bacterium]|nr:3-deoxy-D-manno-octulosonic acid transferase [Elusimicrobiota bacterium]